MKFSQLVVSAYVVGVYDDIGADNLPGFSNLGCTGMSIPFTLNVVERLSDTLTRSETMADRRDPTPAQRQQVLIRDNGRCVICGCHDIALLEIDHAHPWALGGRTILDNLQAMCPPCNKAKGTLITARIVGFPVLITKGLEVAENDAAVAGRRAEWALQCERMREQRFVDATARAIELWKTPTAGGNQRTKRSVKGMIAAKFGKVVAARVIEAIG